MFYYKSCVIFKNTFFMDHLRWLPLYISKSDNWQSYYRLYLFLLQLYIPVKNLLGKQRNTTQECFTTWIFDDKATSLYHIKSNIAKEVLLVIASRGKTFCSLLVARYFLLVARYFLLVTRCSFLFARYFLLVTICSLLFTR